MRNISCMQFSQIFTYATMCSNKLFSSPLVRSLLILLLNCFYLLFIVDLEYVSLYLSLSYISAICLRLAVSVVLSLDINRLLSLSLSRTHIYHNLSRGIACMHHNSPWMYRLVNRSTQYKYVFPII